MALTSLAGLTLDEISSLIRNSGFTHADAQAVCLSIYRKRIKDIPEFRKISLKLRNFLSEEFISGIFLPTASQASEDSTVKYLFRSDDNRLFETVYIPDLKRNTVCVSTQSGCRMGCAFCVTADYGFHGNLSAGEIINQVLAIHDSDKVTHVVMMGMGEPMDNIDNVLIACEILTAEWGLAISPRNITVSTVGISTGIRRFLDESQCNLTLSVFSPFSDERGKMVPAEKSSPVSSLIDQLRKYPLTKKRRFSLAYMMMSGINDTDRHLESLKSLVHGSGIRINLLPFHPSGDDKFIPSPAEKMMFFKHSLVTSGISASIRKSRGSDISAACGLLASGLKK
jgi:23S rRNA (adenine2503-C2)-methyltransferase